MVSNTIDDKQGISINHQILTLKTIEKHIDADARNDIPQTYTYFKALWRLMLPYFPTELKIALNDDMMTMDAYLHKVKEMNVGEDEKIKLINEAKNDFMEVHSYYVFNTLSRTGMVIVQDDAIIDFDRFDITELKKVIRNQPVKLEEKKDE